MKFNIGDNVKCINAGSYAPRLVQGRNYTIIGITESYGTYDVIDDFDNIEFFCYEFRFEDIKKVRKQKLEKLNENF